MVARLAVLVLLLSRLSALASTPVVLEPRHADDGAWVLVPTPARAVAHATADTVVLYGGPGRDEGHFEDADGQPTFGDWTPVDRTVRPGAWQRSSFMAANLGGHGPGNQAMWAGVEDAAFAGGAGYGNLWDAILLHESAPVSAPTESQTVALDFVFNLDAPDGSDRFVVEYETSTGWRRVLDVDTLDDPSFASFAVPGVRFVDWQTRPIHYAGGDYADGDRVRIRLRFRADATRSDGDGELDGDGPVQIDDIVLTTRDGSFTEDFEGPGPYLFASHRQWFGDFATVYVGLQDVDAAHQSRSAAVAFVDRGQDANNPMPDGTAATGGAAGSLWTYGPDGAVVAADGGLSTEDRVWNEIWSPELTLEAAGAGPWTSHWLEADVYTHVTSPFKPVRFLIGVRAQDLDGRWLPWVTAVGLVDGPLWFRARTPFDAFATGVADDKYKAVQFALGVRGIRDANSGDELTPAPYFDNVRVLRTRGVQATSAPSWSGPLVLEALPNPFNPRTTIHLRLNDDDTVSVTVHDLRGARIRSLHDGPLAAGDHAFTWDGHDDREQAVGSGVYFVRAISAGMQTTKKIALVK